MSVLIASWVAMILFNCLIIFMFNMHLEGARDGWREINLFTRCVVLFTPYGTITIAVLFILIVYSLIKGILSNE